MTDGPSYQKEEEEEGEQLDFESKPVNVGPNIYSESSVSNSKNQSYYDSESYYAEDSQDKFGPVDHQATATYMPDTSSDDAVDKSKTTIEFKPKQS